MSTLAHERTREFATNWDNLFPSAVFSGIVGDRVHALRGGRHISIEDQPGDNWSVVGPDDKAPPGSWPRNLAAACDMSMAKADMVVVYHRVYAVWEDRTDPRRVFFGGWNVWSGSGSPRRLDFQANTNTVASVDHTWHAHGEWLRRWVTDNTCYDAGYSMLSGETKASWISRYASTPPPPKPPTALPWLRRAWPSYMPANHWFGDIKGPTKSHGGYYVQERPDVKAIQQELIRQGYVPGVNNLASSWADGKFERETVQAVARFQQARMPGTQFLGQFWKDDWRKLFTY